MVLMLLMIVRMATVLVVAKAPCLALSTAASVRRCHRLNPG
jgi:hypothetical protein